MGKFLFLTFLFSLRFPNTAAIFAVSLTQKSSDVSLVGRDQLARDAWAGLDTCWSTGPSTGQQQRVRVGLFAAEGQDSEPSRANHWRDLGAVSGWLEAGWQIQVLVGRSERTRECRVLRGLRLDWDAQDQHVAVAGPPDFLYHRQPGSSGMYVYVRTMHAASLIEHHII